MMVNFIIVLVIMALAAWLGNLLLAVQAGASQTRARIRSTRASIARLEKGLKKLGLEEESLLKEIETEGNDILEVRRRHGETQLRLADVQAKRRPRMLILSDRRNAGDKDWIVTVANPQIAEIDGLHPLAKEWQRGRDYLVWAPSEREAGERAQRRFSARPGFAIRSVSPAKDDIFGYRASGAAA